MINPMPQNIGFYPGYGPMMIENHTNPEAEQFRQKMNDEIQFKQAYVRLEFLQNTLSKYANELTQVQKNVLNAEIQNAQRDLSVLQYNLNAKYGVAQA